MNNYVRKNSKQNSNILNSKDIKESDNESKISQNKQTNDASQPGS